MHKQLIRGNCGPVLAVLYNALSALKALTEIVMVIYNTLGPKLAWAVLDLAGCFGAQQAMHRIFAQQKD